jgi:hypothetical protein
MELADLRNLAQRYAAARAKSDRLDAQAKAAQKDVDELEDLLWDVMERDKTPTLTFEDLLGPGKGVQLQRKETRRARIIDYDTAVAAIRELGLEDEILDRQRKVRSARLNQEINERIENGDDLPAGVDFTSTRFITLTKKGA